MKVTREGRDSIIIAWGHSRAVALAAFEELFRQGELGSLDYDSQVNFAMDIGILAGETKGLSVEVFLERFEREILNYEG